MTNKKFEHHFDEVLESEKSNFRLEQDPVYFDVRFSNVCNFKCRICGPWSSSKWHNDAIKMGMKPASEPAITNSTKEIDLLEELDPYLLEAEEFYFAGGEPLVTDQHYKILEKLIENKQDRCSSVLQHQFFRA